jgi:hypothetical protein
VEPIAFTEFTDGATRPVFEEDGLQFVIDDGGEQVCGVWPETDIQP